MRGWLGKAVWRGVRIATVLAAMLAIVVAVATLTPEGHAFWRAALFVPQVLPDVPVGLIEWAAGTPTRTEVSYPLAGGASGIADLYFPPDEGRHGAVLLFLGVNPAGRDDPRVVGLANGLARSGAVVMIPWSEAMTHRRVSADEVGDLVNAFQFLASHESVDPDRVGVAGFCVGASLVTVAAADPRINDRVKFVNFFGGYFDANSLVKAVVTESRWSNGVVEPWRPDSLSEEVVAAHLIEGVPDPAERRMLTRAFASAGNGRAQQPPDLSQEAQVVFALLNGPAYEEADSLIGALPETTRASLSRISPSEGLGSLRADVLIMHDREDDLVPSEESRRFAEALPEEQVAVYTEFSFFQHVDPTRPVSIPVYLSESLKLFRHMYGIMLELG